MFARLIALFVLGTSMLACGSSATSDTPATATTPAGHTLTISAKLTEDNGELPFVTASLSVIRIPKAEVVGKPYMIATFPAGFSPGNDPPIHSTWGRVPADLSIAYTTPATYADGAYDAILLIYATTPITDEVMKKSTQFAPPAVKGDLASFSNDASAIRAGDPSTPLGAIRLNVAGANAATSISNRTPSNPNDQGQFASSFTNTVMIIP